MKFQVEVGIFVIKSLSFIQEVDALSNTSVLKVYRNQFACTWLHCVMPNIVVVGASTTVTLAVSDSEYRERASYSRGTL